MARPSAGQRQRERAVQLRILKAFERQLGKKLTKVFKAIGKDLAESYADTGKAPAHISAAHRKALSGASRAILLKAGVVMGSRAVGLWKARNPFQKHLEAWVDAHVGELITTLDATAIQVVRDLVANAVANPDHVSDLARAIRERFDGDIGRAHAERVARTEVHIASSVAQHQAAEDSEVDLVKTWCAAQDDRTRESHAEADGQTRELDEAFSIGGASMIHPGEGPAEETINCRCCVLYLPRS